MEYYIEGNPDKAEQINSFFTDKGYTTNDLSLSNKRALYFTVKGYKKVHWCYSDSTLADVLRTTKTCYKHIELPKFKVGDVLQDTRFFSTVEVRAIDLEKEGYVVLESTGAQFSIPFECAHKSYDYYDKKEVTLPFKAGDLVLGRDKDSGIWRVDIFSHTTGRNSYFYCAGHCYRQCIPFKGNESLAGTSQKCCKQYPSWCYGKT